MASILSLPDEILETIGTVTVAHLRMGTWCRLTSTCRRLWSMQFPESHKGWGTPKTDIEGAVWMLRRMQAAPWLFLNINSLGAKWKFDGPGPHKELINSLQKHMEAAIAASKELQQLKVLDVNITLDDANGPKRVASLLQQWLHSLLGSSVKLEALGIAADKAPCPPVLGFLPKLRHLELTLCQSRAWLDHFFVDLSFCSCLESLRITQGVRAIELTSQKLPEIQLSALPKLQHIELVGWFPETDFNLPPNCKLCVEATCGMSCPWEEQWRAMQRHLMVLLLKHNDLQEWPAGLESLSQLKCLQLQCTDFLGLDIAVLQAIPHVTLYSRGMASLILTSGAWQSLEVHAGRDGLLITFTDADAFVRGTERFLFSSTGKVALSQPTFAAVKEACSRQYKACYQCRYRNRHGRQSHTVRLSNCEDVMRLEPSEDGTLPSGGLHDGYAGTPEDSPLWDSLWDKKLMSLVQLWPEWDPYKWVFGQ